MDLLKSTLFAMGATVTVALSSCGDPGYDDTSAGEASETAAASGQPSGADAGAAATPASDATTTAAAADVDDNPPGDACGASKVAAFVSQKATAAVKAEVAAAVGHSSIRWVEPDTAVTQDYSPERLNVAIDANDVITGGSCG